MPAANIPTILFLDSLKMEPAKRYLMMKITVVSYNNVAPAQALSAVFGETRKTLGRGDDNFFILPDPKHLVSRVQASIQSDGVRHTIVNLSKATPILVNGRQIDRDQQCALEIGDEIQIGPYLLRAESHLSVVGAGMENMAADATATVNAAGRIQSTVSDPDMPVRTSIAQMNLELDDGDSRTLVAVNPPNAETKHTDLPETAADNQVPAASPETEPLTSVPKEIPVCTEPLLTMDGTALMQAFLNGAGIPSHTPWPALTPEFMEMIGKLLATSIQGTVDLSSLRTLVKREANAEVTMVVVRNNNPIKFFRDGQTVLTQMLRKKMPGFMGPIDALEDAYQDLRAHQLGVVAGMQAAMAYTLGRLNPEQLTSKLEAPSMLDAMFPKGRKAGLWDRYVELFQQVDGETEDDLQGLFGEPFRKAYEQEVERLRNGIENA